MKLADDIKKLMPVDSRLRKFILQQVGNHREIQALSAGKHAAAVVTGLTRLKMVDIATAIDISYSSLRTWSSGDPLYQAIEKSALGLYSREASDCIKEGMIKRLESETGGHLSSNVAIDLAAEFADAQLYIPELIFLIGKSYFYNFAGDPGRLANCRMETFLGIGEKIFNGYLSDLKHRWTDAFITLAWKELQRSLMELLPAKGGWVGDIGDPDLPKKKKSFTQGDYELLAKLMLIDKKYHELE